MTGSQTIVALPSSAIDTKGSDSINRSGARSRLVIASKLNGAAWADTALCACTSPAGSRLPTADAAVPMMTFRMLLRCISTSASAGSYASDCRCFHYMRSTARLDGNCQHPKITGENGSSAVWARGLPTSEQSASGVHLGGTPALGSVMNASPPASQLPQKKVAPIAASIQ